jgi:hypothetical protein
MHAWITCVSIHHEPDKVLEGLTLLLPVMSPEGLEAILAIL